MATYNSAEWIEAQLESILSQTYKDFRLLVRDDGSSDQTLEIIDSFAKRDTRIALVSTDGANMGVRQNFSALMDAADSDYVMLADADDLWLSNKIELTMRAMRSKESEVGSATPILVHTDLSLVGPQLEPLAKSFWRYFRLYPQRARGLNRLIVQNNITGCTAMLNRALLQQARPVDEMASMHDHWIALVASAFGTIVCVDQPTVLYRQHSKSATGVKVPYDRRFIAGRFSKLVSQGFAAYSDVPKRNYETTRRQAEAFLARYQNELSPRCVGMLSDFVNLKQMSAISRRVAIVRHALFRTGLVRNIEWLVFI